MNQQLICKQLPCHFYHSSICRFVPCPYSHEGESQGHCINESCAICFKQYAQCIPPLPGQFATPYHENAQFKRAPTSQELINFMIPVRRHKNSYNQQDLSPQNTSTNTNDTETHHSLTSSVNSNQNQNQPNQQATQKINQQLNQQWFNEYHNKLFATFHIPQQQQVVQSQQQQQKARSKSPDNQQKQTVQIIQTKDQQQQVQVKQSQFQIEKNERKVQSDSDQWLCINCGYEHNNFLIKTCQKCQNPKINKKLDQNMMSEFDTEIDYLFVIDFECNCTRDNSLELMEIIEFPIVVIDTKQKKLVNQFSSFVKPTVHEKLSSFCTELTGITQAQVDQANPIEKVLKAADYFLRPYLKYNCVILNDCYSDMRQFLLRESEYKNIQLPDYMKKFINLKKVFPNLPDQTKRVKGLDTMLEQLGLEFVGRKHSGITDSKNIARAVIELLNRNYIFSMRLCESIYPFGKSISNQNYKYMIILSVSLKNKSGCSKVTQVSGILFDLTKNQVMWSNVFNFSMEKEENSHLSEKEKFESLIKELNSSLINCKAVQNKDFVFATLGRKNMDYFKFQLQLNNIQTPSFLQNNIINLKKQTPELKKIKEKKTSSNDYLIEEAMKALDISPTVKISSGNTSSLMDGMNIAQIVKKLVIKGHIFALDNQQQNQKSEC